MLLITNSRLPEGAVGAGGQEPDAGPGSVPDEPQPSANERFYRYHGGGLSEIPAEEFGRRLRRAPDRQVLLYLWSIGHSGEAGREFRELCRDTGRLQRQCDGNAPGLVQVVPVVWLRPDIPPDGQAATGGAEAAPRLADLLRRVPEWRDEQDIADRKRINVFAHGGDVRALREALWEWMQDPAVGRPLYGVFRNIFLAAADVDNGTLEAGRSGQCFSDAARNVVVYYANDDWRLPIEERARCLGHTGPADMSRVAKNVYGVDCDGFNNKIHCPDGHEYFLAWKHGEPVDSPSPVWTHMLLAMETGRVEADPATRTAILVASEGPSGRWSSRT